MDSRSPARRRQDSRSPRARQRSRIPPATAAKAKSKPPSSSSTTPPRPPTTGKDLYSTPTLPSEIRFPKNISKYAVGWESFEAFPVQNDMKRYVETLCASARLRISGGALLEHDLTWDRGGEATPETICRFYYLAAQDLTCKDPPLPTKTERILFWCHDTDVGALWNMLQSRDMLPMNAHGVSQFNCNIFYALGREICGGETDEYNTAWVLYNTTRSAKNLAGLVVGGKAWGSLRKHYGGSFETARAATQEDQVLKDSNPKAFCVSRNRYTASTTSRSSNLRSHPPLPGSSSTSTYEQPTSSLEDGNFCSEVQYYICDLFVCSGILFCNSHTGETRSVCPGSPQNVSSSVVASASAVASAVVQLFALSLPLLSGSFCC